MKVFNSPRFLVIYSAVVTVAFCATALCGFALQRKQQSFEQINVQRINLVEPDGTVRMVISDKAFFPGSFVRGKEWPRSDRKSTGMIFMDDEGTEMGGLIFDGSKDKNGKVRSNGHLSFDQYMQDQTFSIDAGEENGSHYSAIVMGEHGDYPITEGFEASDRIAALPESERAGAWKKFFETHPGDAQRIVFGRSVDNSAVLRMKDSKGKDRLVIQVQADGSPVIKFLDESGKVTNQLPR